MDDSGVARRCGLFWKGCPKSQSRALHGDRRQPTRTSSLLRREGFIEPVEHSLMKQRQRAFVAVLFGTLGGGELQ